MFRLAVADVETGILHVNVSAISSHKYARTLSATLHAFLYASPKQFIKEMARLPASEERDESILYYSVLLHELRHVLDLLVTPYGAWRIRHTFQSMTAVPQMLGKDIPIIIPFELAGDPFYGKFKLGLENYEETPNCVFARYWKAHKNIIAQDNRGFQTENKREMQFGGEAMLEALAFGVQADLINAFSDDAAGLRDRFPAAFEDFRGADPTHVDVTYRWYALFNGMIGTKPSTGTAKLTATAIFASLCGRYMVADPLKFRISIQQAGSTPTRDLSGSLPSRLFQKLIGDLINRYEGMEVDPELTWQAAWDAVDVAFRKEFDISIFEMLEEDLQANFRFLEEVKAGLNAEASELMRILDDAMTWFQAHLENRRRTLERFRERPYLLVDHLSQMDMFGTDILVPIMLEYPESANEVIPLSKAVDTEYFRLPNVLSKRCHVPNSSFIDRMKKRFRPAKLMQRVYYSSFIMKGVRADQQDRYGAWPNLMQLQAPLFKAVFYGDDPMDISGRSVHVILKALSKGKTMTFAYVKSEAEQMVVSSAENYFEFHGIERAQCDFCEQTDAKQLTKHELVSVSAASSRGLRTHKGLPAEIHEMARLLEERDWSESRVCEPCFRRLFPQRSADRYFNVER